MVAAQIGDVPFLDITNGSFEFTSSSVMRAREQSWYARTQLGPLVLRYDEATRLLADRRLSPAGTGHLALHGITSGPIFDYFSINMSSRGAAGHSLARSLLAPFLSPRRLDDARRKTVELTNKALDELATRSEFDFMADFADHVTATVACEVLGVPLTEYSKFGPWSRQVGLVFGANLDGVRDRVEEAIAKLTEFFVDLLVHRRRYPGDDFVSALAAAQHAHDLSEQQCVSMLISLIMGGHDAPMHQLGYSVLALSIRPKQWALLCQRPELAPRATEEILRWTAHTHTARFAFEPVVMHDLVLEPGDAVLTCNSAANMDPRAFAEPEVFDIERKREHLPIAFGGGPYFCPGNALGRMEISVVLVQLTQRFRPPEIVGPIAWRPATTTAYGPDMLPMRLTAQ